MAITRTKTMSWRQVGKVVVLCAGFSAVISLALQLIGWPWLRESLALALAFAIAFSAVPPGGQQAWSKTAILVAVLAGVVAGIGAEIARALIA